VLADAVGCTLAGLASPQCARLSDIARRRGGAREASVAGCSEQLPASQAAILHAALGHWYEWDDVHDPSALHPGIVIWPVVMASAEAAALVDGGAPAHETLAVAAACYDVAVALGRRLLPHLVTGWMPTGIACTIAAAGGAVRLRGGNYAMIRSAMGLAAAGVGLSRQALDARVNGKNMLCALAASRAMEAADLALAGIDGAPDYLDGPFGVARLATGGRLDGLSRLHLAAGSAMLETSIKPYPSCRSTHPAVDLALELRRHAPDIASMARHVVVRVPRPMAELCGKSFEPADDARVAAQFSIPYCVAVALSHGSLALGHFSEAAVGADTSVLDLAGRVVVESYELEPGQPILGSRVEILATDYNGTRHQYQDDRISGSPMRPLDQAAREEKFRACTSACLSTQDRDRLHAALLHFETNGLGDVAELLRSASLQN
jgi:2-methylcitrate dehydratase PrpD